MSNVILPIDEEIAALATTPRGLPYPLPTDPVSQGAAAIRALAEAIDPLLGGELAYASIVANVTGIVGTSFAGATAIVTAPSFVTPGSPFWVEFYSAAVVNATASAGVRFALSDGGADQGIIGTAVNPSAGVSKAFIARVRMNPAGGLTKTYSIVAYVTGGTGQVSAGAGGPGVTMPTYIRITRT